MGSFRLGNLRKVKAIALLSDLNPYSFVPSAISVCYFVVSVHTDAAVRVVPNKPMHRSRACPLSRRPLPGVFCLRNLRKLMAFAIPVTLLMALAGCGSNSPNQIVPVEDDFTFSATPNTASLSPGGAGQSVLVTATAEGTFNSNVSVALTGLPAGVTASPATLTLKPGVGQNIILTASSIAAAGTTTVTFTGTSGTLSHASSVSLTVTSASLSADFSLSATPTAVTVAEGGMTGTTVAILATGSNGFNSNVAIAFSGLPAGVTANPATLNLAPGTPQNVTLTASGAAVPGVYTVTVTGTSGGLSNPTTFALTVVPPVPPSDFALVATPPMQNVAIGSTTGSEITLSETAISGFAGSVAVTIGGLPTGVTASPATLPLTPGVPQNIMVTAAATAVPGTSTVTFTGTSGALTHTATVALTVLAAGVPDFSLSLTPSAQTLTIGATGGQIAVMANALNGFTGSVTVAFSGLPAGVTASPTSLTLTPGTAQNVTLTAASTASAGNSTVTFTGTSGALTNTAPLTLTVQTQPVPDVTTYHYDNTRQGLNAQETILTPANVNSTKFGKLGFYAADGAVDAQPLFVANVVVSSTVTENLVYVASEHDSVYAYATATGQQVWKTSLLGSGETTSDDHGCGQITPEIGITSTPVIDRTYGSHGAIFVVGMTKDSGGSYHQRLHALDLTTGAELTGSPTEIAATYPGTGDNSSNGMVTFAPGQYAERAGLLLLNGTLYLAWTSHCDGGAYTGWVMGYSESTLQQTQVINVTPNGSEGAIWMAGYGLAADTSGNIYFSDGNGAFSGTVNSNGFPTDKDFGNGMIKLSTAGGTLSVADYYEPYDTISESAADTDLGSGGAMLLPDLTDGNGNVLQLIVGAGKDHNIYVANRNNMGKFNMLNNTSLYQELDNALENGAWSGPAYFNNTVYYGGQGDVLKAFPITNAKLATTPSSKSAVTFYYPGTTPSVSANGTSDAIVWAVQDSTGSAAVLYAYDATNLANEFYDSNQASGGRDNFGNGNKFITPVVVNGNLYVGTPTGVAVFGLLP
jgi:hypothetical protein